MTLLDEILTHNEKFVENKEYEKYQKGKFPNKKLVILSCMDTRLVELLPKSMNVGNGDVKIVKNAGALISHPFGSIMRSILVGVYELKADEVCVVGHHDCGMSSLKSESIMSKMTERGISEERLDTLQNAGVDLKQFLKGFDSVEDSVRQSVSTIQNHPLIPKDVPVHGLVINPDTGKLDVVSKGY
ncbi:carbonic anhydrase [Virgibacillus subterraneus]|uniref:carbonic anhydrase n=2 Tax=Virgibacillus TaxID=84406 RepID=A0A1H1DQZ0_9BACI|nr:MULTISPECIES: carbonic anhydrase [Virgibacillus]SDQ78658.1 carbonic anhydrase [Virgibacillus salinus]SEQ90125.1 carbonic anhydrase [Virgibacillus subterraneus]